MLHPHNRTVKLIYIAVHIAYNIPLPHDDCIVCNIIIFMYDATGDVLSRVYNPANHQSHVVTHTYLRNLVCYLLNVKGN